MSDHAEQIDRLRTAELQFRLASAVRLASTTVVFNLDDVVSIGCPFDPFSEFSRERP